MKTAILKYVPSFEPSPIQKGYTHGWVVEETSTGQHKKARCIRHPFCLQRRQWCQLWIEFDGVQLWFSIPRDLDEFRRLAGSRILPSGGSLIRGRRSPGRPNNHWISRLPKKAKSWKFRQSVLAYLGKEPKVKKWLAFYDEPPLAYEFSGVYNTYFETHGVR